MQIDNDAAQLAHILRRTGFAVSPADIGRFRSENVHDVIDAQLEDQGSSVPADEAEQRNLDDIDYDVLQLEWLDKIVDPQAGLHERMVWFWHSHFTTNRNKANDALIWRQHQLMRRNALGNVRTLAREILTDGAMLTFLDGAGSRGDAPNENLSREYLELFTLGRNAGYTEDDVRAGARILAGWWVDWETGEVGFSPEDAYNRPVTFLGTRTRWNIDDYVEAVLAQPACAEHIAAKLHDHLVSTPLSDVRRQQLGDVLRSNDWEVHPLLAEILHGEDFVEARGRRTRQPVEWLAAASNAFGFRTTEDFEFELWQLSATGQVPFEPPNVAGWPNDQRWSSATQIMARANTILNWELSERLIDRVEPTPQAVLAQCGVFDPSPETFAALDRAIDAQTEFDRGLDLLFTLALVSPEFAVC